MVCFLFGMLLRPSVYPRIPQFVPDLSRCGFLVSLILPHVCCVFVPVALAWKILGHYLFKYYLSLAVYAEKTGNGFYSVLLHSWTVTVMGYVGGDLILGQVY